MKAEEPPRKSAYAWFCLQVFAIVRTIPSGKVMTYGSIAALIPKPDGIDSLAYKRIRARWAGYALKRCPDDVPWWRVVNRLGQVSVRMGHGPHIQRVRLEEEGIIINEQGILPLEDYLWNTDRSEV
jgi:methylated-DNA-protein-cysteine methyltransferase-like protein